jgi:hypothetical protein
MTGACDVDAIAEALVHCAHREARSVREGIGWCVSCGRLRLGESWICPTSLAVLTAVLGDGTQRCRHPFDGAERELAPAVGR